jgi:hypothetical protein
VNTAIFIVADGFDIIEVLFVFLVSLLLEEVVLVDGARGDY